MRTATVLLTAIGIGVGACVPPPSAETTTAQDVSRPTELTSLHLVIRRASATSPTASVEVEAELIGARAPQVVLVAGGGVELGRSGLERRYPRGWLADVPIQVPGDYQVVIVDQGRTLAARSLMARVIPCAGGARRLEVVLPEPPGFRTTGDHRVQLLVPRWVPVDRDPAYVVEWLFQGQKLYEDRGRAAALDEAADRIERADDPRLLADLCAFSFGEVYSTPEQPYRFFTLHGDWEVRIHRESAASIAARFTIVPPGQPARPEQAELADGERPSAILRFAQVDTPDEMRAILARIPNTCRARCSTARVSGPTEAGRYRSRDVGDPSFNGGACAERVPALPHASHDATPNPLLATPEELRAIVRSADVLAQRIALNVRFWHGESAIERPDFEYEPDVSPDQNWHRRRQWENRDYVLQVAQEADARRRALPLVPALRRRVVEVGATEWTTDEIPAPPGWR